MVWCWLTLLVSGRVAGQPRPVSMPVVSSSGRSDPSLAAPPGRRGESPARPGAASSLLLGVSWCNPLLCCLQATSSCTDTSVTKASPPSRRRSPVSRCRTEDTRLSVASTISEAAAASSMPTCTTAPPCPTRKHRLRRRRQPAPPALLRLLLPATNSRRRCWEVGWLVYGC